MNKEIYEKIIKRIIINLKENKNIIRKLNEQDKKHYDFELNLEKLIEIVTNNQYMEINQNNKNIFVISLGNPYVTMLVCLEAILAGCKLFLDVNEICYGVNKGIVGVINRSLNDLKIDNSIIMCNNFKTKDIQQKNIDKIICLGDNNSYMIYRKMKDVEVKHIPLFNIKLYYDDEQYDDLVKQIYNYAIDNFFEIEIFDNDEDFKEVVNIINICPEKNCSVFLSKDEKKQDIFKNKIKDGIICINENPFKKFEYKLSPNIFL